VATTKDNSHADQHTFIISARLILLGMKNVWDTGCRENQNTCLCSIIYFVEYRAVHEIMQKMKYMVEADMP